MTTVGYGIKKLRQRAVTAPALARPARMGEPGFTSGGRIYEDPITGKIAVSITSVTSMLPKDALKYWAAKQAAEYAADNLDTLAALDRDARVSVIKGAPWRTSGKAADNGDIVHSWIENYIKGGQSFGDFNAELARSSLTAKRMWGSFQKFVGQYNPEFTDSEFTVWSERYDYAGTGDWSARIGQWHVLGDTKTGKGVYPEVGLQIAALANADYIINADGTRRELPRFDKFGVLHIRPMGFKLVPLFHIDECFQAFVNARGIKRWKDNFADLVVGNAA